MREADTLDFNVKISRTLSVESRLSKSEMGIDIVADDAVRSPFLEAAVSRDARALGNSG